MDDPSDYLKKVIEWLILSFVGMLAWFSKRIVRKVDSLEKNTRKYVTRDEFNVTIKEMREHMDGGHDKIQNRLDEVFKIITENRQ